MLLSFDIEEFDLPQEYGCQLSFDRQIEISVEGTRAILDILNRHNVKATFFCTANFAKQAPNLIKEIASSGHEIASHGYYHSSFGVDDYKKSRDTLQDISGNQVYGFRMARMSPVDYCELTKAGYLYDSSINPTYLPGRYNNLNKSKRYYYEGSLLEIPSSVTPYIRLPLFWLLFHNIPVRIYQYLLMRSIKYNGYGAVYFHPWEFTNLKNNTYGMKIPGYILNNSGATMISRLDNMISHLLKKKIVFLTFNQFFNMVSSKEGYENKK